MGLLKLEFQTMKKLEIIRRWWSFANDQLFFLLSIPTFIFCEPEKKSTCVYLEEVTKISYTETQIMSESYAPNHQLSDIKLNRKFRNKIWRTQMVIFWQIPVSHQSVAEIVEQGSIETGTGFLYSMCNFDVNYLWKYFKKIVLISNDYIV